MTTGGRTGGLSRRAQRGAASPRVLLALAASTVVTAAVAGPMAYQAHEARQASDASTPITARPSTTTTTTEVPASTRPPSVLPETKDRDGSISLVWARSWAARANTPVADATVSGTVFIYLHDSGTSGLTAARFWVDDPEGAGPPLHVDPTAPFTVVPGPTEDRPGGLDTATLANGKHSVLVELVFDTTTIRRVATFAVANG